MTGATFEPTANEVMIWIGLVGFPVMLAGALLWLWNLSTKWPKRWE